MNENINAVPTNHCDNLDFWKRACQAACQLGWTHAALSVRAKTETEVMTILTHNFLGQFGYRRAHASALRRIYGAVMAGPRVTRYAKARGL